MADDTAQGTPLPDTPILPVTLDRIEDILQGENLDYYRDTNANLLRLGFPGVTLAIVIADEPLPTLTVEGLWRGQIPPTQAPQLLGVCNEWNTNQFAPTMRFFENRQALDPHIALGTVRTVDISHGLSRNQIGAFILATIENSVNACRWVESLMPELVTWTVEE